MPWLNTNPTVTMSRQELRKVDVVSDEFPKGLRVLVIDDDITTLMVVESMLRKYLYFVTTCSRATVALDLLRERKGCYDVVISDVHMPDMDGFSLLEFIGLEMDLPVIMMSVDEDTRTVMKGIRYGACDYLIKPLREEELKNIWQHVVRRKIESKETEYSGSLEDNDPHRRGSDSAEHTSVNEGVDVTLKTPKKRKDITEEDDDELLNDDQTASKKPRVVWSVDLHEQFVRAVRHLGVEKAVPKRILEMMNAPGLTRENVASHLQKFRLHLKRLSVIAYPGGVIPSLVGGPIDSNLKVNPLLGRFNIQTLAASGQIPSQTLAALHAELYGLPGGSALGGCSAPTPTLVSPMVTPSVHADSRSKHSVGAFSAPRRLHVPGPSVTGYLDRCTRVGEVFDQGAFRSPVVPSCFGIEQHGSLMSGMVKDGDLDYFDDGRPDIPNDAMGVFNDWFNI